MTNDTVITKMRELVEEVGGCCGCSSMAKAQADKVIALLEEMWKEDHRTKTCACNDKGVTCRAIDHG